MTEMNENKNDDKSNSYNIHHFMQFTTMAKEYYYIYFAVEETKVHKLTS